MASPYVAASIALPASDTCCRVMAIPFEGKNTPWSVCRVIKTELYAPKIWCMLNTPPHKIVNANNHVQTPHVRSFVWPGL